MKIHITALEKRITTLEVQFQEWQEHLTDFVLKTLKEKQHQEYLESKKERERIENLSEEEANERINRLYG